MERCRSKLHILRDVSVESRVQYEDCCQQHCHMMEICWESTFSIFFPLSTRETICRWKDMMVFLINHFCTIHTDTHRYTHTPPNMSSLYTYICTYPTKSQFSSYSDLVSGKAHTTMSQRHPCPVGRRLYTPLVSFLIIVRIFLITWTWVGWRSLCLWGL